MAVIGRLDNQVEDVLIAPLEKTRRKINHDPGEAPAPDENDENERHKAKKSGRPDPLPVWLL